MGRSYSEPVKEFYIYTGLRIALFLGSFGIVVGLWFAITGQAPILWAVVIAFVVSGMGSYFLLNRQREALARRVQTRAEEARRKKTTDQGETPDKPDPA